MMCFYIAAMRDRIDCLLTKAAESRPISFSLESRIARLETVDMISRQKSCVPCAKAKRRCEPQTPKCPRCARRGTNCYYKNQPVRGFSQRPGPSQPPSTASDEVTVVGSESISPFSDEDLSQETRRREAAERWRGQENSLLSPRQLRTPGLHSACPFIVPITIMHKQCVPNLTRRVMSWPTKFVRKLETPFIHSSLRDTPSLPLPLEEAFSACASYACREETTKSIVMNIIERRVSQLIELDPSAMSFETHLASLQAFLILHTIQLWDGDVRQRAQAEMHSYILESWALQLHMRASEASKQQDAGFTWEWWVTLESARRTAITTLMAQGIYELNKYGVCSYVPNLAEMPFTINDGPWNAQNSDDWEKKIGGIEAAVANYSDYALSCDEPIYGHPSEFGKFLLMPCPSHSQRKMILLGPSVPQIA
ncbi:hypothetical protein F4804DRAFT_262976 [Jackrogersella minutella]|nr:hypothetical protein F4804DRAFT_262976 [Jackrogersella minutella]